MLDGRSSGDESSSVVVVSIDDASDKLELWLDLWLMEFEEAESESPHKSPSVDGKASCSDDTSLSAVSSCSENSCAIYMSFWSGFSVLDAAILFGGVTVEDVIHESDEYTVE